MRIPFERSYLESASFALRKIRARVASGTRILLASGTRILLASAAFTYGGPSSRETSRTGCSALPARRFACRRPRSWDFGRATSRLTGRLLAISAAPPLGCHPPVGAGMPAEAPDSGIRSARTAGHGPIRLLDGWGFRDRSGCHQRTLRPPLLWPNKSASILVHNLYGFSGDPTHISGARQESGVHRHCRNVACAWNRGE